jgi:hypothetical protein
VLFVQPSFVSVVVRSTRASAVAGIEAVSAYSPAATCEQCSSSRLQLQRSAHRITAASPYLRRVAASKAAVAAALEALRLHAVHARNPILLFSLLLRLHSIST